MFPLTRPRHPTAPKQPRPVHPKPSCDSRTDSSSPPRSTCPQFKRQHHNATRTKVTQFLEYRSERIKTALNPSLWLISKTYLKKLETVPSVTTEQAPRRKISWSEEAEFVYFNVRKNSASVSQASRHTFSLEDEPLQ